MKNKKLKEAPESLQFAVYGGICGVIGLFSIVFLFFAVYECKPGLIDAVARSIVSITLALMSIHFGMRSKTREGIYIIILGISVIIIVSLLYIIGIIPCILS